jgi:hypothetical protein
MDTTLRMCCQWKFSTDDCPTEYTLSNMRIFEQNGLYYLYGSQNFDSQGVPKTNHLPLNLSDGNLILDDSVALKNLKYSLSYEDNMPSSANNWPFSIVFLDFKLHKGENGTLSGSWTFKDQTVFCPITMSNGTQRVYYTGEFAGLKFTRIGE